VASIIARGVWQGIREAGRDFFVSPSKPTWQVKGRLDLAVVTDLGATQLKEHRRSRSGIPLKSVHPAQARPEPAQRLTEKIRGAAHLDRRPPSPYDGAQNRRISSRA